MTEWKSKTQKCWSTTTLCTSRRAPWGPAEGDKRLVCGAGGSLGDAASCAEPLHLASRPPPRPPAAGRAPRPRPRLRHPPQPRHPGGVSAEKIGKEDHK